MKLNFRIQGFISQSYLILYDERKFLNVIKLLKEIEQYSRQSKELCIFIRIISGDYFQNTKYFDDASIYTLKKTKEKALLRRKYKKIKEKLFKKKFRKEKQRKSVDKLKEGKEKKKV